MRRVLGALPMALLLAACASPAAPSGEVGAVSPPASATPRPTPTSTPRPTATATPVAPTATPVQTDEPAPPTPRPKPIIYTVTSDKTTKPFYIGTDTVTLRVKNRGGTCGYAAGGAYMYPKGAGSGSSAGYVEVDGCKSAESEVYLDVDGTGPGYYYLHIITANTTTTITVVPHD